MGLLDLFRRNRGNEIPPVAPPENKYAVGAKGDDVTITFNDRNITFSGDLATYDYNQILRDKQRNIYRLFE